MERGGAGLPLVRRLRLSWHNLANRWIEVCKTAFRAPNTNACVKPFIRTIQQEYLNHFVILGLSHSDYLVLDWLDHYHTERPHQAIGNEPPKKPKQRGRPMKRHGPLDNQVVTLSEVRCKQRLGGLLKSYSRRAA